VGIKQNWNDAMTHSKTVLIGALAAACLSTASMAGDWTNSGMYNGYGATTQNTASSYSMRDANGNLTMVNGQVTSSSYSAASGAAGAQSASSGVGTQGAGSAYGQATAIGNSLNVVVVGSHNTTIIDAQQTNTGNQTANATLNTH
jgi:holdfast attachment protein HfaA